MRPWKPGRWKLGEHGQRLASRQHFRRVYATPAVCSDEETEKLNRVKVKLGVLLAAEEPAGKSWYKTGKTDIPVVSDARERTVSPLSSYSSVIVSIKSNNGRTALREVLLFPADSSTGSSRAFVLVVLIWTIRFECTRRLAMQLSRLGA